jgi:hypothetical protein
MYLWLQAPEIFLAQKLSMHFFVVPSSLSRNFILKKHSLEIFGNAAEIIFT